MSDNLWTEVKKIWREIDILKAFEVPKYPSMVSVSAAYTITAHDYIVRATGTFSVYLPPATGSGAIYIVKNSGVGTITLDAAGADTIEGSGTATLAAGASNTLLDGAMGVWEVI